MTAMTVLGCVVVVVAGGLVAWRWYLTHAAALVQARAEVLRREESILPEQVRRLEERVKALEYRASSR